MLPVTKVERHKPYSGVRQPFASSLMPYRPRAHRKNGVILVVTLLIFLGLWKGGVSYRQHLEQSRMMEIHQKVDEAAEEFLASLPIPQPDFRIPAIQAVLDSTSNPKNIVPDASIRICELLGGKRVVFVGPLSTYHLHNFWLETLQSYEGHILTCPGPEFCVFHHICYPGRNASSYMDGRKQIFPNNKELYDTRSAVLQYVLSTSLETQSNKNHDVYTRPMVDAETGVRTRNYYWLRKAQKASVVVLGLGPVSAPSWTYAKHLGRNSTFIDIVWPVRSTSQDLIAQALNATLTSYFVSLRRVLSSIQQDSQIRKTLILWHGHWPLDPSCTNSGLPLRIPRIPQFWLPLATSVDRWTFYYNFQSGLPSFMAIKVSNVL